MQQLLYLAFATDSASLAQKNYFNQKTTIKQSWKLSKVKFKPKTNM